MLVRLLKIPINLLAWMAHRTSINRISYETDFGKELVRKTRLPFSQFLIWPGNLVFRLRHPVVEVLSNQKWIDWEKAIFCAVNERNSTRSDPGEREPKKKPKGTGRCWVCEKIPGEPLVDLLARSNPSQRQQLLDASVKALKALHSKEVVLQGQASQLSHGDATCHNVLIDEATSNAKWFDFDLRHRLNESHVVRQADDLRSLLFSSIHFFELEEVEKLAHSVYQRYDDSEVWHALQKLVSSRWFMFDVFHLAQLQRSRRGASAQTTNSTQPNRLDEQLIKCICNLVVHQS